MSSSQHSSQYAPPSPILIQRARGDRPHLLHFNRRLRHLRGISFRNLALAPSSSRARSHTIDDEAVPYTLSSTAKLLALNEVHELAHSRSSDNLKAEANPKIGAQSVANGHAKTPLRRPRRRNTAEWLSASPKQRRKKVQEAITRHTGDVFFSVQGAAGDDADMLYISEVADTVMNHDFRFFDLGAYGTETTSQTNCKISFWARQDSSCSWLPARQLDLDLRSLTYVGRSLDEFYYHLPDNFVFVHLSDGIYAPATDILAPDDFETPPSSFELALKPTSNAEPTSSYDALMRLSTLDAVIQDALVTQANLTSEISTLLAENDGRFTQPTKVTLARDQDADVDRAITTTRKQIASLKSSLASSRKSLDSRREAIDSGRKAHAAFASSSSTDSPLSDIRSSYTSVTDQIHGQRRRLCSDLSAIYPIDPSSAHSSPLAFTIRTLHLPNSNFDLPNTSATAVAAALGYVAHCVHRLSLYLSVLLPYPITARASTSTITDPISLLPPSQSRVFPLHINARGDDLAAASGSASFGRFEYAVFLLNKDIEALTSKLEVRVVDIRQTLPNLKYVFLVATSGKGEVPKRMAGGVKGLIGRALEGASRESSRRGSEESGAGEGGRAADELRRKLSIREGKRSTEETAMRRTESGGSTSQRDASVPRRRRESSESYGGGIEERGITVGRKGKHRMGM